ncbi:hypothetical protein [Streptomyces sp. NEAU-NA10]|uniref:hypothetical protein n=1 Tax=Streptomyces sp. NEAU-NA10 TaxID=3416050 RepID=UPI003CC61B24
MREVKCPGCPGRRAVKQYLCPDCWRALPNATRGRLALRDPRALFRLRQLHQALEAGTPLGIIRVSR